MVRSQFSDLKRHRRFHARIMYIHTNSTTRANLERLPIFQGEAVIFVRHPCLHDQTDTEKIEVSNSNTCRRSKRTSTTSWSRGNVLATRTASQTACADSSAYYPDVIRQRYDCQGMGVPGIIPSSCVHRRNPLNASSSVATTYSARPESFNQACSGPTPG